MHIAGTTIDQGVESIVSKIGRASGVRSRLGSWVVFFLAIFSLASGLASCPLQAQVKADDLTSLSLEDLMNTKVTSVSKTEQKISRTASAIFVITSADIARSGATNIPDLLRMVPGVDVAQIDANTWAITARGLNGRFSNELLVLLDGRTVYTPSFGGVFWDVFDLPLEDIERIEVIRGPGGTIWGANAVNGVVNIITKRAAETRGGMVVAGGGNLNQGFGTTQYGGGLGARTDYRVFAKYFNQDHLPGADGGSGADGWHLLRTGFRMDSRLSTKDQITVEGDMYTGQEGVPTSFLPSVTSPGKNLDTEASLSGGYLHSVWDHAFSSRSGTSLQLSFDRYKRNDFLRGQLGAFDLEFAHHFAWGSTPGSRLGSELQQHRFGHERRSDTLVQSGRRQHAVIQRVHPGRNRSGS